MSLHLGPIHEMMYRKMLRLDLATEALLETLPDEKKRLDQVVAPLKREPLEQLIDQDNIHGWLASCIDRAEIRYAFALNCREKDFGQCLEKVGEQWSGDFDCPADIDELFSRVNMILLDGMPCDRALTAYEQDGELVLHQEVPVHHGYAQAALGEMDPELSRAKTCAGNHDHDHHESFDLATGPRHCYDDDGGAEIFYQARERLLTGFVKKWGYKARRQGQDFYISKQ